MAATIAFAILSIASAMLALRSLGYQMNRGARVHSLLAAVSRLGLTAYLAYWGIIGARRWML